MRKFVILIGFGPVALLASLAMANGLTFYSPYEILADHPGCAESGMVALHVKFDAQADAYYFLDNLPIALNRNDSCEIKTRKGTSRTTLEVPCPEGVAPAPETEEQQRALDRKSALPRVINLKGEMYHCLMPEPLGESRERQVTMAGFYSAELPRSTGFMVEGGEFEKWNDRAVLYPSRTELLFDGSTEVTLPPYLRLFIGPTGMIDDTNAIDDAEARMIVDIQLVPLIGVSCDLGGEKC